MRYLSHDWQDMEDEGLPTADDLIANAIVRAVRGDRGEAKVLLKIAKHMQEMELRREIEFARIAKRLSSS